ncbi:MAG: hypothetical protein NZU74_20025 [Chloroflexaceae bacterium]|nr:hypothetical protein [Chloroflexaceae bacterium]
MNKKIELWAFASLMGCLLFLTLSFTLLSGGWAIVGSVIAVILGILSGGLFGLSIKPKE